MHTTKPGKSLFFSGKGFHQNKSTGWPRRELVIGEPSDQLIYGVIRRHFRDGEEKEEQRRIMIGI